MRWRLLLSPALGSAENMALDHALFERARTSNESVLRVYSWSVPTLSFGRNQKAEGLFDQIRLAADGVEPVRRPTGGRALLHDREITYSVTAPITAGERLVDSYSRVNGLLVAALSVLGVPAAIARPTAAAERPGPRPCFSAPARGEIVVDGRKLVGSAQWREEGAWLQHGSILTHDDQVRIPSYMRSPGEVIPQPATLAGLINRDVTTREFADTLFQSVQMTIDPDATAFDVPMDTQRRARALERHYADPDWTWRR